MKWKSPLLLSALALTLLVSPPLLMGQNAPPSLTTLYAFSDIHGNTPNTDGYHPMSALVQGPDGSFYGTAASGGSSLEAGTIFKITPGGVFSVLHRFNDDPDGGVPLGKLSLDDAGNLYGTTNVGYPSNGNYGTIYKLTPAGVFTVLHTFVFTDGSLCYSGLTRDEDGNFYGTTSAGGTDNHGTVFKLTPGGTLTTLHHFKNRGTGGMDPYGAVVRDGDGNLYSTTFQGGSNGYGTIFKLTSAGVFTTLYSFGPVDGNSRNADGAHPQAGLTLGSDGNLYGTAPEGGSSGYGTVFQITPAGAFKVVHQFTTEAGGRSPYVELIQARDGNFYGTTYQGGKNGGGGTIFRLTPAGTLATLHSFTINVDGGQPYAPLTQGVDGNFYGTTYQGGKNGVGTIFVFGTGKPVILGPGTAKGTYGAPFSYQIAATGAPKRFAVDGMGGQMHVDRNTGLISGYPLGAGTHTLTLHAFNAQGEGTQTLALTIDKEAPVITSPATASAVEGQPFSYQITADNAPTQFQVLRLIPDLHVDAKAGLISGTPTTASGTFRLTLKAVNGQGTGTQILQLSVAPP